MNWISSIGSDKRLSDLFFRVQQKFSFTWTSECLSLQQKHQSHQTHEQQSSILVHCKVACHNKKHWIIRICSPSRETKPSVKQQRLPSSLLSHQLPQIQCQTQSHSGDSRKWSITGKSQAAVSGVSCFICSTFLRWFNQPAQSQMVSKPVSHILQHSILLH